MGAWAPGGFGKCYEAQFPTTWRNFGPEPALTRHYCRTSVLAPGTKSLLPGTTGPAARTANLCVRLNGLAAQLTRTFFGLRTLVSPATQPRTANTPQTALTQRQTSLPQDPHTPSVPPQSHRNVRSESNRAAPAARQQTVVKPRDGSQQTNPFTL
jgi:hypothetical protein